MSQRSLLIFPFLLVGLLRGATGPACAAEPSRDARDWPHWRGPQQNGVSVERNLPDSWSLEGENLLWRKPEYATRSTPVVLDERLYVVCRAHPETTQEGEKVVCVGADTGQLIWETVNNVFLSDAPAERVGWSSVVADPETGNVYVLGLGCYFQCLDGRTGAVQWARSMSEEYGMLSTYGGRTNFPIVFEDLVIISGVTTGWGDLAVPAHRFVAFDKRTGDAVWLTSTRPRPEDTTYSTPIITCFDGQAAMVVGGGDGWLYALQPRTGAVIWEYHASNRGINTTPLVQEGIVYCGHAEQNADSPDVLGAFFALDGRRTGTVTESDLLWKIPARTVGKSAPLLVDDRLYAVDDGAKLWIMDPRTGADIASLKLGTRMTGSLVYGDGKFFVGEETGRWYVLRPTEKGVDTIHRLRLNGEEILGSPSISRGRVYLPTNAALYCLGTGAPAEAGLLPAPPQESPVAQDLQPARLQVVPVEGLLEAGQSLQLTARVLNARGQRLEDVPVTWSVEGPATVDAGGQLLANADAGHAVVTVTARGSGQEGTAHVRVVPPLPWTFDFADGQVPATWIGAKHRHQARELEGESVLVKVSTVPKGTRSQLWMGPTALHDYTIEADFLATEKNAKLPDMGLINQRYTLVMNGLQELQIRSWTSRLELRFAKTIPWSWQAGTWYRMKFRSENADGQAVLRGKVWPREQVEPADWSIEAADATPNTVGSPGMFGNASDAEFYIDNVRVYANR